MIETIITIGIGVAIFIFKSIHDYMHRKKINNDLHNKIDGLMNLVNIMQDNLLPKKESDIINNALNLEENLLNQNDSKDNINDIKNDEQIKK